MNQARDGRWSEAVKKKANNKCIHCNGKVASAHHIMPRGCLKTRYVLEDGIYCCNELHRIFEGKKGHREKEEAIRIFVGGERYRNLEKIKNGLNKPEDFSYTVIE